MDSFRTLNSFVDKETGAHHDVVVPSAR